MSAKDHYDVYEGSIHLKGGLTFGEELDGSAPIGYFYLTSTAADTETVTINGRVYEFDTNSTSTGDVAVDISGDQTADAACTALAAAINGDGSRDADAVVMAGNADTNAGVLFIGKQVGSTNFSLATTCANGVVSAAAFTGAASRTPKEWYAHSYTISAADVSQLATTGGNSIAVLGVPSTTSPTIRQVYVTNANGGWVVPVETVRWTLLQANSNYRVLALDDSAATLAANDVVHILYTL